MTLSQFAFFALGLIVCFGDVKTLSFLFAGRERAFAPNRRLRRLLSGVLPGPQVLGLLLTALTHLLRLRGRP